MNLPYVREISKNVSLIDTFGGINHGYRIGENEFSQTLNMCSDDYPVLSARQKRKISSWQNENGEKTTPPVVDSISSAVVVNDMLATLTTTGKLNVGGIEKELNVTDNKLVKFGNKIYVYPSGKIVTINKIEDTLDVVSTHTEINIVSPPEGEDYSNEVNDDGSVYGVVLFQPYTLDALDKNYSIGINAPSNPESGDYWYDISTGELKMFDGNESVWTGVVPTLIRIAVSRYDSEEIISVQWLNDTFKVGDVLYLDNTGNDKLDERYYAVEAVGSEDDPGVYVGGYFSQMLTASTGLIRKEMPQIDFAYAHNNRMWGCRFGLNNQDEFVNEIYASALGDPTTWFRYSGNTQDSWAASLATDGKFTGIAVVGGYLTFFKENCMHRIYGDYPAEYQIFTYNIDGVQEGCEASLDESNGRVFYKSPSGVMVMTDSYPQKISDNLKINDYKNAVGCANGDKYFLQMSNDDESKLFVFDANKGIWHKETPPSISNVFVKYRNSVLSIGADKSTLKQLIKEKENELTELEAQESSPIINALIAVVKQYLAVLSVLNIYPINITAINSTNTQLVLPEYLSETDENTKILSGFTEEKEEDLQWSFETGTIGYSIYEKKYLEKILMRFMLSPYTRLNIAIMYNNGEWEDVSVVDGTGEETMHSIPIRPNRCDTFKIKAYGEGTAKLISTVYQYSSGSDS